MRVSKLPQCIVHITHKQNVPKKANGELYGIMSIVQCAWLARMCRRHATATTANSFYSPFFQKNPGELAPEQ